MKALQKSMLGCLLVAGSTGFALSQVAPGFAQEPLGLANPAAVFCVEREGKFLLDTGQCVLPDGTTVDAWEYFRTQHPSGASLPNPAAVFCDEEHGTYDLTAGTCTLRDGSVVDAWEYFRSRHAK